MHISSKFLPTIVSLAFLAQAAFASNSIYDRDLVRGFIALKGDFRSMKSDGVKLVNDATDRGGETGSSYTRQFADGHVEIGGEYNQLRTWIDVDFMPITPTRGGTEWFTYGITWMWGYKLFSQNSFCNIIPSIGPGLALLNIRDRLGDISSSLGPALNLELELRYMQFSQFSVGFYGGYKIERHYNWNESAEKAWAYKDANMDKVFVGLKFSWTMLNNFQRIKKEME